MIRYVKQNDQFTCGPLGIANALKFAGVEFSYKSIRKSLMVRMRCTKISRGTYDGLFDKAVRDILRPYMFCRKFKRPSIKLITEHIQSGGAVLSTFKWDWNIGTNHRHVGLIVSELDEGQWFGCVNLLGNEGWELESRRRIKKAILRRNKWDYFWLVSSRDDSCGSKLDMNLIYSIEIFNH